jgi:septal ring factor EnvC (AmiA/AmiB activator)
MSDIVSTLWMIGVDEVNREVIPVLHSAAAEITRLRHEVAETQRLRTELAEAQAAREQTIKNWEADIRAMNANRDTLRQQLAVAREGLEKTENWRARDTLAKLEQMENRNA